MQQHDNRQFQKGAQASLFMGFMLGAMVFLSACAAPSGLASRLGPSPSDTSLAARRAAQRDVDQSRRTIEAGQPSEAIPQLQHVVSAYPATPGAVEARFWLGVAYYNLDGYQDAATMFQEYLRLAPDGPHAAEAAARLQRVSEEYAARFDSPSALEQEIADARAQLVENPGSLTAQWRLADVLWRSGEYAEAGRLYARIARQHPEYAGDSVLRSRVELLPSGEYTVLTPAEVRRRQEEANPVVVLNTASFRTGRDLLTQVPRIYVVTGQVLNQSDRALHAVRVFVTVYGFGDVVYDTSTVHIGRLYPGETRAFSVRFGNFENIASIDRYECVPTYER